MTNETKPRVQVDAPHTAPPGAADLENSDTGILDLLAVLSARKRMIGAGALAGGAIAAVIAFWLPNLYTAAALIMPPQQPQTTASSLMGQLAPLAAVAGRDLGLKSPADLYLGLLSSRSIADRVIERFGLKAVYEAKTMVDARAKFKAHTRASSGKDSLIRIEVDDTDPQRAADVANAYVAELNAQNSAFGTSEANQRRTFLESQLTAERESLASAEDAMKQVQSKTGIIQVEAQTSVAIATVAQLKAQITAGEVALQRLKMGATPEHPAVRSAETELAALRAQLKNVKEAPRAGGDPLIATTAIPQGGLEYIRRLRELKYHEFLYEMLSKQYEAARLDESRVAPAIQVVDAAVAPDKKSGPHRGLIIAFGVIASFMLASVVAYAQHGVRQAGTAEQWRALRAAAAAGGGRVAASRETE